MFLFPYESIEKKFPIGNCERAGLSVSPMGEVEWPDDQHLFFKDLMDRQ